MCPVLRISDQADLEIMAPQTRGCHEEEQVQRRADCQEIARGGSEIR